jgi:hypothetical protein
MNNTAPAYPKIHETVFIAEGTKIFGDVKIATGASIWFNAVLRGDEGYMAIGADTNIQDNVVIHSDMENSRGDCRTGHHRSRSRDPFLHESQNFGLNIQCSQKSAVNGIVDLPDLHTVSYGCERDPQCFDLYGQPLNRTGAGRKNHIVKLHLFFLFIRLKHNCTIPDRTNLGLGPNLNAVSLQVSEQNPLG